MRHDSRYEELDKLEDYELEHESQDIRGYPLVDSSGRKYGVIGDLLVGRDRDEVVAVELEDGRVTPVEPLEIHDNAVVYGDRAEAYADRDNDYGSAKLVSEERIPVVEEKVVIGKRVAEDSGKTIHVRSKVVKDRVEDDVHLRKEHVDVDRKSVDREVSADKADKLFDKAADVTMREKSEEAVVGKKAMVKDEVVVRKTAEDEVEHVSEEVRKTKVDVDGDGRRT